MVFGEVTVIPVNGHGPEDVVVDDQGRIYKYFGSLEENAIAVTNV